jgi:voltage-gated potassium channel
MLRLVGSAIGLATVTVILHGIGTLAVTRHAVARWGARKESRAPLGAELLLARVVSLLLLLHLAEAMVWAVFHVVVGELPDFESAVYFSLTSYTTVGYGDLVLPAPWRLLGPIEATVGVLMLGWSTGILVAIIGMTYREVFPGLKLSSDRPR